MGFFGSLAHQAASLFEPAAETLGSSVLPWAENKLGLGPESLGTGHAVDHSGPFAGLYDGPPGHTYVASDSTWVTELEARMYGQDGPRPSSLSDIGADAARRGAQHPLSRISLDGHGEPGTQYLDDSNYLQHTMTQSDRDAWGQIGGALKPDGRVQLDGCNVAQGEQGEELLGSIAEASGHEVHGGTARQIGWIPGIEGPEVTVRPDGTKETKTGLLKNAYAWLDKRVPW